jgi:hypothetical protein
MTCFGLGFGRGVAREKKAKNNTNKKNKQNNTVLGDLLWDGGRGEGSPMHVFFVFSVFALFFSLLPRPVPNPTQNKSSKMFACLFFLLWGRGGELISKYIMCIAIWVVKAL